MRPGPLEYLRPRSLDEAVAAGQSGTYLAGGQTLVPQLKLRTRNAKKVVDLNGLDELIYVREENEKIAIGALTRYVEVARSSHVIDHAPALVEAIMKLGDAQVRNRGTLGGNLCWGESRANTPVALLALDATVHVLGPEGADTVPVETFIATGPQGRLVTGIELPKGGGGFQGYREIALQPNSLPIVNIAVVLDKRDETSDSLRIAVGGLAEQAVRLRRVETALQGQPLTPSHIDLAVAALDTEALSPLENVQAGAVYRRKVAATMLGRLLTDAAAAVEKSNEEAR